MHLVTESDTAAPGNQERASPRHLVTDTDTERPERREFDTSAAGYVRPVTSHSASRLARLLLTPHPGWPGHFSLHIPADPVTFPSASRLARLPLSLRIPAGLRRLDSSRP